MNIDSDRTNAFYQLAKTGSFSLAAKNLGITQSALSQKIAKLEDELEMTLAIRQPKGIQLTSAGEEIIKYCKTKENLDQNLLNQLGLSTKGKNLLNVAGFSSISRSVLLPIMAKFNHKLDYSINLSSRELYELPALLQSGEVDFIFTYQELTNKNIKVIQIAEEELVHIIPKKMKQNLPFIDHDPKDTTTFNFFKVQDKSIQNIERIYFDEIYNIIAGVELGLGQAIVSKHLVKENKAIKIKSSVKPMKLPLYFSYLDKSYYSPIEKDFIQFIHSHFSKFIQ